MDKMRLPMARILVHSEGLGALTSEQVRQRARELALINGHEVYTQGDWQQAKIEMHGGHLPNGEFEDEMAAPAMVSERDMLSAEVGHHTPRVKPEDDGNVVEELWQEGMEEAEHERMLGACRVMQEEED